MATNNNTNHDHLRLIGGFPDRVDPRVDADRTGPTTTTIEAAENCRVRAQALVNDPRTVTVMTNKKHTNHDHLRLIGGRPHRVDQRVDANRGRPQSATIEAIEHCVGRPLAPLTDLHPGSAMDNYIAANHDHWGCPGCDYILNIHELSALLDSPLGTLYKRSRCPYPTFPRRLRDRRVIAVRCIDAKAYLMAVAS